MEESPRNRIPALDIARGLAVLFMVWVHVLEEWSSIPLQHSTFGRVVEFFGSAPAAPVFMILMGAALAFSKSRSFGVLARRGLSLLLLGYLLNFLRGAAPAFIGLELGLVQMEELAPYTPWNLLGIIDILIFAGPALVVLGAIRLVPGRWLPISLAFAIASASPSLWGLQTGFQPLDGLLRHLWGVGPMVSFPMFPWLAYPLVGMAWGSWLAEAEDRTQCFNRTALLGLGLLTASTGFLVHQGEQLLGNHWRVGLGGVTWIVGFVALWLWLCHHMSFRYSKLFSIPIFWSRHVTRFYFFQWLLVAWGTGLVGRQSLSLAPTLLSALLVLVLAHGLTHVWIRRPLLRRPISGPRPDPA